MSKYTFGKTVVIALGGSIVFPDKIDSGYLGRFKKFTERFLRGERGRKFVIVIGGGRLARIFQNAAAEVVAVTDEDKDWIGVHSTRLNAHLLRTVFCDVADPVIFDSRGKIKKLRYPVTIASGWRPGWSTDFVAAAIVHDLGAREFIVAGKPAYVYDDDPGVNRRAKPLETISWRAYRKLIPAKWIPGSHAPVDPVAARFSDHAKIKAMIVNGKDLANFDRLLNGKEFRGTIIG